jgi:hypothetical protein
MLKWIKRIGLTLVVVHVLSYVFLSEWMMERKVCDKYLQFTERRFANPYNKNVNETILVSSCGDEFLRDLTCLIETAQNSNPEYTADQIDSWDEYGEDDFNQSFHLTSYPQDIIGRIHQYTDTLETSNCIVFEVCAIRKISFVFRTVSYRYIYSSQPTDFHIMKYTDRYLGSEPHYVWLLFTWVEFRGQIGNYL